MKLLGVWFCVGRALRGHARYWRLMLRTESGRTEERYCTYAEVREFMTQPKQDSET